MYVVLYIFPLRIQRLFFKRKNHEIICYLISNSGDYLNFLRKLFFFIYLFILSRCNYKCLRLCGCRIRCFKYHFLVYLLKKEDIRRKSYSYDNGRSRSKTYIEGKKRETNRSRRGCRCQKMRKEVLIIGEQTIEDVAKLN